MNLIQLSASAALAIQPVLAQVQDAEPGVSDARFLSWVEAHAVPFDALDSSRGRALVDRLVEGKRFVFLGEPDHFIQTKMDAQRELARQLHRRGWRRIGMERGRSDGIRYDRFLATGDEEELDRVALFRSFAASPDAAEPTGRGLLGAIYELARSLRALGTGEDRIRYFGYDLDMIPGGAYVEVAERMGGYRELRAVGELASILAELSELPRAEQLDALAPAVESVLRADGPLVEALSQDVLAELREDLVILRESLHFVLSTPQTVELMQRREEAMFRSVDHLLAQWDDDERVLFWGHCAHLSKDSGEFEMPVSRMWRSVGTHIAERFPGQVCSIWVLYDHGDHRALYPRKWESVPSLDGSVEQLLAGASSEAFLFPIDGLAREYLDQDRVFRFNGKRTHGKLARQADAILFFRETRAAGGWSAGAPK